MLFGNKQKTGLVFGNLDTGFSGITMERTESESTNACLEFTFGNKLERSHDCKRTNQ